MEMYYTQRYSDYDKPYKSKFNRRLINGKVTNCGNCVGYCQCDEHPGFLTREQRKQHNCIFKECFHYLAKEKKTNETEGQRFSIISEVCL